MNIELEGKTREERLEHALRRVLDWPLPARDGSEETVATWALPGWLADMAREALEYDLRVLDSITQVADVPIVECYHADIVESCSPDPNRLDDRLTHWHCKDCGDYFPLIGDTDQWKPKLVGPVCNCGGNHSAIVGDTSPGAGHAVSCPVRIVNPPNHKDAPEKPKESGVADPGVTICPNPECHRTVEPGSSLCPSAHCIDCGMIYYNCLCSHPN